MKDPEREKSGGWIKEDAVSEMRRGKSGKRQETGRAGKRKGRERVSEGQGAEGKGNKWGEDEEEEEEGVAWLERERERWAGPFCSLWWGWLVGILSQCARDVVSERWWWWWSLCECVCMCVCVWVLLCLPQAGLLPPPLHLPCSSVVAPPSVCPSVRLLLLVAVATVVLPAAVVPFPGSRQCVCGAPCGWWGSSSRPNVIDRGQTGSVVGVIVMMDGAGGICVSARGKNL